MNKYVSMCIIFLLVKISIWTSNQSDLYFNKQFVFTELNIVHYVVCISLSDTFQLLCHISPLLFHNYMLTILKCLQRVNEWTQGPSQNITILHIVLHLQYLYSGEYYIDHVVIMTKELIFMCNHYMLPLVQFIANIRYKMVPARNKYEKYELTTHA